MNFQRKCLAIFISIQIFYVLYLPTVFAEKKKKGPKLGNLPLVLLKTQNSDYSFPRCFRTDSKGVIFDFTDKDEKQQVFFCPKSSNDDKECLYPSEGKDYKCDKPPTPVIRKNIPENGPTDCGNQRDLYSYGYQLCDKDTSKNWQEIYSFCFDKVDDQVAYVKYRIQSPNLLIDPHLHRERSYNEFKYRLTAIEDENLKAYLRVIMDSGGAKNTNSIFTRMELGHSADMIFPIWKKPFYSAVNHGLLVRTLKDQWRHIGRFLRKKAQKLYLQEREEMEIITGTRPYADGHYFGTWWKLVIYKKQAIVIILHNIMEQQPEVDDNGTASAISNKPSGKDAKNQSSKTNTNVNDNATENYATVDDGSLKKNNAIGNKPNASKLRSPAVNLDTNSNHITTYQMLCDDICSTTGFKDLVIEEVRHKNHAYCCNPKDVIKELRLEKLNIEEYKLLDLDKILNDEPESDDGCPKEPIQVKEPENGKTPESSNNGKTS